MLCSPAATCKYDDCSATTRPHHRNCHGSPQHHVDVASTQHFWDKNTYTGTTPGELRPQSTLGCTRNPHGNNSAAWHNLELFSEEKEVAARRPAAKRPRRQGKGIVLPPRHHEGTAARTPRTAAPTLSLPAAPGAEPSSWLQCKKRPTLGKLPSSSSFHNWKPFMENLFEAGRPEKPAGARRRAAVPARPRYDSSGEGRFRGPKAPRFAPTADPRPSAPRRPPAAGRAPAAPAPRLGRAPATRMALSRRGPARPQRIGRSPAPSAPCPPLHSASPGPAVPVALTLRAAVTTPPGSAQPPAHPRTSGTRPSLPVMRGRVLLLTSGRDAAL